MVRWQLENRLATRVDRRRVRLLLVAGLFLLAGCRSVHSPDLRSLSSPHRDPKGLDYVTGSMEVLEQCLDGLDRRIENAVY